MTPPGALLRAATPDGTVEAGAHLRGFGGVHGGLALALLTTAMEKQASGELLKSVTARYLRPLGDEFAVQTSTERSGRTVTGRAARAVTDKGVHVDARATFATPRHAAPWTPVSPSAPTAPSPQDCGVFTIPPELVAISTSMEIRPVGSARPYGGGATPELTAWIRLTEDDDPPDVHRLILLMDGLAPSSTAVLSEIVPIPTVEFTAGPADGLGHATSPWVLLRARTHRAGADGWVEESIDAWGPDGDHLGSARQLRVARPARRDDAPPPPPHHLTPDITLDTHTKAGS